MLTSSASLRRLRQTIVEQFLLAIDECFDGNLLLGISIGSMNSGIS